MKTIEETNTQTVNPTVVNGAARAVAITGEALLKLVLSKGHTEANLIGMRAMGADDTKIAEYYSAMPDANPAPVAAAEKSMAEQLAELRAENERLRAAKASKQVLTCKVSEKKAMSVYGLGQWPVTLYKEQWAKLISEMPKIQAFLRDNDKLLAVKPVK